MSDERIGFVGVGLMGQGMAANILAGGYPVEIIAHRNRQPVEELMALGATEAKTLRDLGKASSIVFICAPGSPQVETIVITISVAASAPPVSCSVSIALKILPLLHFANRERSRPSGGDH